MQELRDILAAQAMQGMLSACTGYNGNPSQIERLTKTAYRYADAMLLARSMSADELNQWGS